MNPRRVQQRTNPRSIRNSRFPLLPTILAFFVLAPLPSASPAVLAADSSPDIDGLRAAFHHAAWTGRYEAYNGLIEAGAPAAPVFIEVLESEDLELRTLAASGIRQLGPSAAAAAPGLRRLLTKDDDTTLRLSAAWALSEIGPAAVAELIAALDEQDGYTLSAAAWALGRIGTDAAAAVPRLALLIHDPRPYVRWNAVDALVAIGRPSVDALLAVASGVTPATPLARAVTMHALAAISPLPEEALAGLAAAARDPDPFIRDNAAAALDKAKMSQDVID